MFLHQKSSEFSDQLFGLFLMPKKDEFPYICDLNGNEPMSAPFSYRLSHLLAAILAVGGWLFSLIGTELQNW